MATTLTFASVTETEIPQNKVFQFCSHHGNSCLALTAGTQVKKVKKHFKRLQVSKWQEMEHCKTNFSKKKKKAKAHT